MVTIEEYNKQWLLKLVKNRKGQYSFIDFFGEFKIDINKINSNSSSIIDKLELLKTGKSNSKPKPAPKPKYITSKRVWVEGTRENFAMYLYDENGDTKGSYGDEFKYYFHSSKWTQDHTFAKKSSGKKPTFYSLKYTKAGFPIIYCNDSNIKKKFFILEGSSYRHTSSIPLAEQQTKKNFYYFYDEITKKNVTVYLKEQRRIRLEKARLAREAKLAAEKKAKIIKYSIIGVTTLVIIIILVSFLSGGKRKKRIPNYANDSE